MSANLIRFETELPLNLNPLFTKWLARSDALREPFVLIDVGVSGGENGRWHFLQDHLVVHGFDASKEAVEDLSLREKSPHKRFHWFAIGNEDGDRTFFFNPSNPSSSRFMEFPEAQARVVPVRRLDTLLKEGVIPKPDFLKMDVEGHERELFLGAGDLFATGVLGVDIETSFVTSAVYPEAGFAFVHRLLMEHGLLISDLNFNRIRRENYLKARKHRGLPELPLEGAGKPATFNLLFCRDPVAEVWGGAYYDKLPPPPRVDQILKLMAIYELHGLNDVAVDIAVTFQGELGRRIDVERAVDLLCDNDGSAVREYLSEVGELKLSLALMRRRVHALRREVIDHQKSPERLTKHFGEELEKIRAELNSVIVPGYELPQPHQYTYEGHAEIDAIIADDPEVVTRGHGAALMRIAPPRSVGVAELHVRILFNCHCTEANSVRVALFEDGGEHPTAILTEDLVAAELTLMDQHVVIPVADASRPPVLEVRAGLAHPGGTLSLNHVPAPALASAVRFRWLPVEKVSGLPDTAATLEATERRYLRISKSLRQARLPAAEPAMISEFVAKSKFVALQSLLAEREALLAEQSALRAEREALIAEQGKSLADREVLLAEQSTLIANQRGLLGEKEVLLAEAQRQIAAGNAQLGAVFSSRSWRITAPFRKSVGWLRAAKS